MDTTSNYLSPALRVEHIVVTSLVGISFDLRVHTRCSSYPHLFLFMIAPVSVISAVKTATIFQEGEGYMPVQTNDTM